MKVGRNDPCPCGSGKKYKKCCGASTARTPATEPKIDYFLLNREIAYKGKIGRQRRDFCIEYAAKKKNDFERMRKVQFEQSQEKGEAISCKKGCCSCCSMYVEATIQECEVIVYWLYQNAELFDTFLQEYPLWRDRVEEGGNLHKQCGCVWGRESTTESTHMMLLQLNEAQGRYYQQNIPCPFLNDNLCSIYEVRPYMCAAHIAISPPERCSPGSLQEPEIRKAVPIEIMSDCSFYYKDLERQVLTFMPIGVYEILKSGTYYFSEGQVQGLENLDMEFITDPEVLAILRKYGVL